MAATDTEIGQARDLCRQWLDWHWKNYPADWPTEGNPMDPERFEAILDDLPSLHSRPSGGILVASLDDHPVGCVMYNEASSGVAEFNRMFVNENGRGYGIGRRLLEHMFEQIIQDGYKMVIFSSANFLTHAKAMYEGAGFSAIPHPDGFPNQWRPYVYFMERTLVD
ncbi:GNAT family N-acetyltransferase [Alisedimentitalea sp. MJ-SS2]|uniref:GNAT family N-acetyltransferase n=1 Tax=Aliisedimentitalea sp. MJ-SS2 TaxID=3049795 RepID=UPI00290A717E|nr:GNAT family N-acetyltransferase [Alisedimentitalea sp. MJ-SS2]MDU8925932.1 GNAT family N-acetyltransferase [Alisedimentitalea sp. MJ-SS2]